MVFFQKEHHHVFFFYFYLQIMINKNFDCSRENMKKQNEKSTIIHSIINQLIENKHQKVFLTDLTFINSTEIKILTDISSLENRVDAVGMKRKIKEISHYFSEDDQYHFGKTLVIKAYCFMLLACIHSNLHLQGKQYLNDLVAYFKAPSDTYKAIYFLFGLKSIEMLKKYRISENKEYKYNLLTQTLFYYVLSLIQKEHSEQLLKQFISNARQLEECHFSCKLIETIKKRIKNQTSDYLTDQILEELAKQEKNVMKTNDTEKQNKEILECLNIAKNRCKEFKQCYNSVMKLKGTPQFGMIIQHLKQTNLVKKLREEMGQKNCVLNERMSESEMRSGQESRVISCKSVV